MSCFLFFSVLTLEVFLHKGPLLPSGAKLLFIFMLHAPVLSLAACPLLLFKAFSALMLCSACLRRRKNSTSLFLPRRGGTKSTVAPKAQSQPALAAFLSAAQPQSCYKPRNLHLHDRGLCQLSHTDWEIVMVGSSFSQPENNKVVFTESRF